MLSLHIKPHFNKCLIELEDDGIIRATADDDVQSGILVDFQLISDHLTTSTGYSVTDFEAYAEVLRELKGKKVFWEKYGETGNILKDGDKRYALIPFYRIIASEIKE